MKITNSLPFAFRFLLIFGLVAIISSSAAGPQITPAFAQEDDNNGMQPLDANGASLYYYLDGQRVNLTPSLDWVSVKFVSADEAEQEAATGKFGNTVTSLEGARSVPHLGLTLLPVNDGLNSKSFVQGVNSMRSDPGSFSQVNPVYSYGNVDMVVSDEFVAAFPESTGMADIEAFNSARGVELVSPITGQANTFVLRITSESLLDALGMANFYQESGFVLFAAPNFVRLVTMDETTSQKPSQVGPMFTPDDEYYTPDQWHLHNTGQFGGTSDADIDAPEAWDVSTGNATVTIAVIDEGVNLTHADLSGNMLAGYDATGLGSAGAPTGDDAHGTAVAGLAAAVTDNTLGVAGVCPSCTILPVRIAYGDGSGGWVYTDAWAADAIGWAYTNGADILNNSWGGGSGATVVNTAITNAVTNGRGGLGSVVVFSAGNDNASTVSWPASQSNVVAVGASNQCDQRKTPTNNVCNGFEDDWGSNYGSALDVVAPGVWLTTTDITGTAGYNDGTDPDYTADYNGYMNGTSGAAPIVSGVLGLMMTVNPYMPADGLQDILEQTTDDINTAGWDNETGYGRVNALKAAQAAELPDLVITGYELYNAANTAPLVTQPLAGESFWIHMTVKNRGGSTGNFYPGVFLDDKPNYGPDHDASSIPGYPVTLTLGETTDYQGYKTTNADAQQGAGCRYYDPNGLIDPTTSDVEAERGNYHPIAFLPGISAGGTSTVEVKIAYPDIPEYPDPPYGDIRAGLPVGTYSAYLYVDPVCNVEESLENNNAYKNPVLFSITVPQLPDAWYGSVSVESDWNVVAVGRPHIGNEIASYDGFAVGSLTAYVPMLFKNAWGSYNAALYIQNVDTNNIANVTVEYYNNSGTLNCTKNDTIDPLASKGYWIPSVTCDSGSLPDGWVGGAVVHSDQPIVAVARPHVGSEVMTYNGFSSGSLSAYLPMLFSNAWGSYNSAFYVQNTHDSNIAHITIQYFNNTGTLNCTKTDTIDPLASKGYWVPAATCDTGSLPSGWVGGVLVTSDQPIVTVGRPHIGSQVTIYDGFATGSPNAYVPMLFANAWGSYDSAFYIQNTHSSNIAHVTIQYYGSSGILNCTKTDTIDPLASKGYWVPAATCDTGSLPSGWAGGVLVNSDQPIVAVGRPHIGDQVTTYNGFTGGATSAFLPMLFKNMWGSYNSAFYLQNIDATNSTDVTLRFYDTSGNLKCIRRDTIPAHATVGYWVPSVVCNQ